MGKRNSPRAVRKEPVRPTNEMAKALGDRLFKPRIVKSGKIYSRRIKHRKGRATQMHLPFFVDCSPSWRTSNWKQGYN